MTTSVEEFIIQLGFDDKKALKDYKVFLKHLNTMNAKVVKSINEIKNAKMRSNIVTKKTQLEESKILEEQLKLRRKITQATNLGLNTSSYEKTLALAKKQTTLASRSLQLEEEITKERLKQSKIKTGRDPNLTTGRLIQNKPSNIISDAMLEASIKNNLLDQKRLEDSISKEQKAYEDHLKWMESRSEAERDLLKKEAQERHKNTQNIIEESQKVKKIKDKERKEQAKADKKAKDDAIKRQESFQRRLDSVLTSSSFRRFARSNPEKSSEINDRFQDVVRRSGSLNMGRGQVLDLDREFKELNATFRDLNRSVSRTQRAMVGLHTVQLGLRDSTRNLIRSYASTFALFAGINSINRVGQDFEAMNSAMLAAMGTQEGVQSQMMFLDELTSRLGLSMRDTSDAFTKFLFAASGKLSTDQTQELFTSLTEFGTVLGISKERMKLSMNAITQMMNKGKISADDLRLQLAESLPSAIQIFSRAAGVSEAEFFKMMENGELLAEDILPKVSMEMSRMANAGGALSQKLMTTRAQQGIFFKELETAGNIVFKSGFDKGLANLFNTLTTQLQEGRKGLEGLGKIFKWFFDTISLGVNIVAPVMDSFFFVLGEGFGVLNTINSFMGNNFFSTLLLVGGGLLGITKLFKSFPMFAKYLPFLGAGFKGLDKGAIKSTKSIKILGRAIMSVFRGPLAIVTLLVAALDEIFSIFKKGRVGLLEKFLFGEDKGFNSIKEFVDYFKNLNFSELTGNLGNAIWDLIRMDNPFIHWFSGLTKQLSGLFSRINWGNVFKTLGITLGQILFNTFFGVINVFAGLLEGIIREIPTMGDFEITDSISKVVNKVNDSISKTRDSVGPLLSSREPKTVSPSSSNINKSLSTVSPVSSFNTTSQYYNSSADSVNNSTRSNTNRITNNVNVEVKGNADREAINDIVSRVREEMDRSFQQAELSNGY